MRKAAALTSIVVGVIMAIAGVVTWVVVSSTLEDQRITVSDDANCAAGDNVNGPISAFCQADIIDHHTQAITGGKTYAELPQDDPNRAVAMDSAFLQASLFTSVVAFGVAGMAFVLGIVLTLIGLALRSRDTQRRPSSSSSQGLLVAGARALRQPASSYGTDGNPSSSAFSRARSLLVARRIASSITGAVTRENPEGLPRLRSVIRVPSGTGSQV